MSLVISTGSNLGDREAYLDQALKELQKHFLLLEKSSVYESGAVDYLNQPDFLNQVLVFETPEISPTETLKIIMTIEQDLGRKRDIDKGPRTVDIDILFWNNQVINKPDLEIPHPRLFERSFIVLPLKELKIFQTLKKTFDFPQDFDNSARVFK